MTLASASRVTRSSRSLRRAALLCAGVLAGISVLRAQEPPAASPPAAASPAPAVAPEKAEPAATVPAADPKAAGKANPSAPSPSTPGRFEPTEKVRADFDVSFPIDI